MRVAGLGEADVARVVIIGGVTSAVMLALLVAKPFHSATAIIAPSLADISQPSVARPATEPASFVTSPTIEPQPVFFVAADQRFDDNKGKNCKDNDADQKNTNVLLIPHQPQPQR